jgi:multicomponent K+:H+ antiporter subunit A
VSILLPWIGALILLALPRRWDRQAWGIATSFSLAVCLAVLAAQFHAPPTTAMVPVFELNWLPELGLHMLLVRDGLSAMFALVTAGISLMVTIFAGGYLPQAHAAAQGRQRLAVFYALLGVFTGAMLGLISSGNLLLVYLFWELTSLASFSLIGFWSHRRQARRGAFVSLIMTTAGGIALLLGLITLGLGAGTWDLPALVTTPSQDIPWLGLATGLVILGALAKSAQFPFSSWLPQAMAAPTPVSAFLHSSALVAAGVYLLARLFPLLHVQPLWQALLVPTGAIGALIGGLFALRQMEMKALLAYSTVSQYAFIFMAFGLASVTGAQAALYAFFIHSAIKAGLFLAAGAITTVTGESRLDALGGLAHTHPGLAGLTAVLALSLGGLPVLGGFYYKEEILHAAAEQHAWFLFAAMQVAGMLTLLYMLRFLDRVFAGPPRTAGRQRRLPNRMVVPIALAAAVPVATGIYPDWMNDTVLDPAIASMLQRAAPLTVELTFSGVLLLSLAVLLLGLLIWRTARRRQLPTWLERLPTHFSLTAGHLGSAYDQLSLRLLGLQSGQLRTYLRRILVAGIGVAGVCWWGQPWPAAVRHDPVAPDLAVCLLISLVAATATLWLRAHVAAIIALSIAGYALAAVFALMHAPDIALAHVLVETLATFSIVAALRLSSQVRPAETQILQTGGPQPSRIVLAVATGTLVAGAMYRTTAHPPADSIGAWYASEGYARTGTADLVTAILVDFRALDTAIEILVFAAAALAIVGLTQQTWPRHE